MPATIGKVAVKVYPDTSKFRSALEKQLKKASKGLKVKIKTEIDAKGLAEKANAKVDEAQKKLKKLHLRVDMENQDSVQRAIRQLDRELEKLREKKVKVKLDEESLQAAKQRMETQLAKIRTVSVAYDIKNEDSLKKAIDKIDGELSKLREVKLDVNVNEESLKKAKADLQKKLNEKARIRLDYDRSIANEIYKSVQGELDKIKLSPSLDKDEVAKARRELAALLEERQDLKVKIFDPTLNDLDRDKIQRNLDDIERRIKEIPAVGLKVDYDRDVSRRIFDAMQRDLDNIKLHPELDPRAMREARRELANLLDKKHELQLSIDSEALEPRDRARIHRELEEIEDKIKDIGDLEPEPEVKPKLSEYAMRRVQSRLAYLSRHREVTLIPRVSKTAALKASTMLAALSGARSLSNALDRVWASLKNIDKSMPLVAAMTQAIGSLGIWGLTAASNLFSLSSSLASIGMAGLALPGIFGGITVGVAATIAVLKDFNKRLPEVKQRLSELQGAMSDAFWAKAEAPIRRMFKTLFPIVERGSMRVSKALGGWFTEMANGVKEFLAPDLPGMFDDLAKSIKIAERATGPMARAIGALGKAGAGYLPRLAEWFGDITTKFANWVTAAGKSGELKEWINEGIEALKDLGNVLKGTGRIFAGLARAAERAGGSTLDSLGKTLNRIADTVESPDFQYGLTGVFRSAHEAMDLITDQSGPALREFLKTFMDSLDHILPSIGDTVGKALDGIFKALSTTEFQNGLQALIDGLGGFFDGFGPHFRDMARGLGALGEIIGTLADGIGPILGEAFGTLGDVLSTLSRPLQDIIGMLTKGLLKGLQQVTPYIKDAAKAFADWWEKGGKGKTADFLQRLADGAQKLWKNLKPSVVKLLQNLGDAAKKLGPKVGDALKTIVDNLPTIVDSIANIIPVISTILGSIADVFGPLVDALAPFSGEILLVLGGLRAIKKLRMAGILFSLGGAAGRAAGKWGLLGAAVFVAAKALDDYRQKNDDAYLAIGLGQAALPGTTTDERAKTAVLAMEKWDEFIRKINGVPDAIKPSVKEIGEVLSGVARNVATSGEIVADSLEKNILEAIKGLDHVPEFLREPFARGVAASVSELGSLKGAASSEVEKVNAAFGQLRVESIAKKAFLSATTAASGQIGQMVADSKATPGRIQAALAPLAGGLKSFMNRSWAGAKAAESAQIGQMVSVAAGLPGRLQNAIAGVSQIGSTVARAFAGATSAARAGASNVAAAAGTTKVLVAAAVSGMYGTMYAAGQQMMAGMRAGINAGAAAAAAASAAAARRAVSAAQAALNIHSPSRVMRDEVGVWIPAGMAEGIRRGIPQVTKAAEEMAKAMTKGVKKSLKIHSPSKVMAEEMGRWSSDIDIPVSRNASNRMRAAAVAAMGSDWKSGGDINIEVPMMPTNATPEDVASAVLFAARKIRSGSARRRG